MGMFHLYRFLCPPPRGWHLVRPGNIEYRADHRSFSRSTDMPSTYDNSLGFYLHNSRSGTNRPFPCSSDASHHPRFSCIGQDKYTFSCPVGHRRRSHYHNRRNMMPWHYLNLEPFSYMRTAPLLLDINRTYSTSLRLGPPPIAGCPRLGATTDRSLLYTGHGNRGRVYTVFPLAGVYMLPRN